MAKGVVVQFLYGIENAPIVVTNRESLLIQSGQNRIVSFLGRFPYPSDINVSLFGFEAVTAVTTVLSIAVV